MADLRDPRRLRLFGGMGKNAPKSLAPQSIHQDHLGNRIPEPEEEIALIEKEIHELKIAFEQYFLGIDRKSPLRRRDLLGERIRRFKASDKKMPTILKHRVEQLHAKYTSFDRVWTRTLAEIEAGTYRADLFKMKLRQRVAGAGGLRSAGTAPAAALSPGQIQALYDAFISARRRTNEPTEGITTQALAKSLMRQIPELIKKYQCKAIDFKVVIKDNRTILKAVPRR